MKNASSHRHTLAAYDRKRAILLEGDIVIASEDFYFRVAFISKIGRRWVAECDVVKDGAAFTSDLFTADIVKLINAGATVERVQ